VRRQTVLILICSLIVLGACSQEPATGNLQVELQDGSLSPSARSVIAGQVTLEAKNYGDFTHTLVVTAEGGEVIAASGLIPPGESQELELRLPPGNYQLSCRIVAQTEDGSLMDHFQLGMRAALRAEA